MTYPLRREWRTFITQAVSGLLAPNVAIGSGRQQRRIRAEGVPSEEDVPWVLELRQRTMDASDFRPARSTRRHVEAVRLVR